MNQDDGQLGQALVDLFQSADLADLVVPTLVTDPGAARLQIDAGNAVAAVIVPAGFTDNIIPSSNQVPSSEVLQIEVYKNPLAPVSAGVIQSIVEEFISRVETGRVGGQVIVTQMLAAGLITPDQISAIACRNGPAPGQCRCYKLRPSVFRLQNQARHRKPSIQWLTWLPVWRSCS